MRRIVTVATNAGYRRAHTTHSKGRAHMDTPERTMATATGLGGAGGVVGAAAGTMLATMVAGGLGFIMGLMFGMAKGEETGYMKGRA